MNPFRKFAESRVGGRLLRDPMFRGYVSICAGMAVNLIYAVFRAVTGILYASVWLISSAVYFLLLGVLRAVLAVSYHRSAGTPREFSRYRMTAWCLLVLNLMMGGLMLQTLQGNTAGNYPGYTIYASATYTFWQWIHTAVQLRRCRRLGSPILSASKAVSFTAALMSVFGLQNAMITVFSGGDEPFRVLMNRLCGAGVFLTVIAISLFMLLKGRNGKEKSA